MRKINLKGIELFTNIARTQCVVTDARESFADLIYTKGNGIKAHALALKVYGSDENTEYDDEEVDAMRRFAQLCSPAFIDAFEKEASHD